MSPDAFHFVPDPVDRPEGSQYRGLSTGFYRDNSTLVVFAKGSTCSRPFPGTTATLSTPSCPPGIACSRNGTDSRDSLYSSVFGGSRGIAWRHSLTLSTDSRDLFSGVSVDRRGDNTQLKCALRNYHFGRFGLFYHFSYLGDFYSGKGSFVWVTSSTMVNGVGGEDTFVLICYGSSVKFLRAYNILGYTTSTSYRVGVQTGHFAHLTGLGVLEGPTIVGGYP